MAEGCLVRLAKWCGMLIWLWRNQHYWLLITTSTVEGWCLTLRSLSMLKLDLWLLSFFLWFVVCCLLLLMLLRCCWFLLVVQVAPPWIPKKGHDRWELSLRCSDHGQRTAGGEKRLRESHRCSWYKYQTISSHSKPKLKGQWLKHVKKNVCMIFSLLFE